MQEHPLGCLISAAVPAAAPWLRRVLGLGQAGCPPGRLAALILLVIRAAEQLVELVEQLA